MKLGIRTNHGRQFEVSRFLDEQVEFVEVVWYDERRRAQKVEHVSEHVAVAVDEVVLF